MRKEIIIKTKDNYELAALVLQNDNPPQAVIQFHAGTVIRKEFYLKFCNYLVSQNFAVVLFDYRGVGNSRPKKLRGFKASISDWGRYDAPAVLNWIKEHFPSTPVHLFAHSMGGQILGLMPNWKLFDKIMVVASSSGNWNNFVPAYQKKVSRSTNFTFPLFLNTLGYVPGRFGLGQDWPKGVAEEWWQNSRKNSLMANYMQNKFEDTYFHQIDKEIIAWFFPDDIMATPKTIPNYQRSFPNAKVTSKLLQPENYNLDSIGHFGLFKEKTRDSLWDEVVQILQVR